MRLKFCTVHTFPLTISALRLHCPPPSAAHALCGFHFCSLAPKTRIQPPSRSRVRASRSRVQGRLPPRLWKGTFSLCSSPSYHFLIGSDHALLPAFFAHVPALLVPLQETPEARSGLVLRSERMSAEQARPRCQRACIPCPSLYTRCRPHTTSLVLHQTSVGLCGALSR